METLVVAFTLVVVAALLLPELAAQKNKRSRIRCTNNLKQVGLAFKIWEGDNNDKYPMAISVTNGGAMEAVLGGDPIQVFQVMSNELSTARLLLCSEDQDHQLATNWGPSLTAKNVSYFINPDAIEANPQEIMSGDDNFEISGIPAGSGLLKISTNAPIAWSAKRHKLSGNLLLSDGSVQGLTETGLANWLRSTNFTTTRLAIP